MDREAEADQGSDPSQEIPNWPQTRTMDETLGFDDGSEMRLRGSSISDGAGRTGAAQSSGSRDSARKAESRPKVILKPSTAVSTANATLIAGAHT